MINGSRSCHKPAGAVSVSVPMLLFPVQCYYDNFVAYAESEWNEATHAGCNVYRTVAFVVHAEPFLIIYFSRRMAEYGHLSCMRMSA